MRDGDHIAWVILAVGVILIVMGVSLGSWKAYPAETSCNDFSSTACTQSIWILRVGEDDIAEYDTEKECVAEAEMMDAYAPPFTPVNCREVEVARTEL
jgi:hypothetical protein